MIKISDRFGLTADKYQFILMEIANKDGTKRKSPRALGYYPTLPQLIEAAAMQELYDMVASGKRLNEIIDELGQWAESMKSPLLADLRAAVMQYENA